MNFLLVDNDYDTVDTLGNPVHREVIALTDQATLRDMVMQEEAKRKSEVDGFV